MEGIVEVGFDQRSQAATAAYSIHSPGFDLLVHGKTMRSGGILVLQAGHARHPFTQTNALSQNAATVSQLIATIGSEAPDFFAAFSSLRSTYCELIASTPTYSRAFPLASSHRQMFAAAVAFLIGENWQLHTQLALDGLRVEAARKWLLDVERRLENASA